MNRRSGFQLLGQPHRSTPHWYSYLFPIGIPYRIRNCPHLLAVLMQGLPGGRKIMETGNSACSFALVENNVQFWFDIYITEF